MLFEPADGDLRCFITLTRFFEEVLIKMGFPIDRHGDKLAQICSKKD